MRQTPVARGRRALAQAEHHDDLNRLGCPPGAACISVTFGNDTLVGAGMSTAVIRTGWQSPWVTSERKAAAGC